MSVRDGVAVGVEVANVGRPVPIGIARLVAVTELVDVGDPVAVDVGVEGIDDTVHVEIRLGLLDVRDPVAVSVGVEEVGGPVTIRVDRRRGAIHVAGLGRIADPIAIRVRVFGVRNAVSVGVTRSLVEGADVVVVDVVAGTAPHHHHPGVGGDAGVLGCTTVVPTAGEEGTEPEDDQDRHQPLKSHEGTPNLPTTRRMSQCRRRLSDAASDALF